jgi:hypothetical protein
MDLRVRVRTSTGSLYRWLLVDEDAASSVQGVVNEPGDDAMGTFEVINAVVANGVALSSLVMAILSWRSQLETPPEVRIERGGVVIVVTDSAPETIAAINSALADQEAPETGEES